MLYYAILTSFVFVSVCGCNRCFSFVLNVRIYRRSKSASHACVMDTLMCSFAVMLGMFRLKKYYIHIHQHVYLCLYI